jgi:hypothetical protein
MCLTVRDRYLVLRDYPTRVRQTVSNGCASLGDGVITSFASVEDSLDVDQSVLRPGRDAMASTGLTPGRRVRVTNGGPP